MTKPIVLLGEAMGENEAKINAGFVGTSGIELLRMLDEAGILELTTADYDYLNKYYNSGNPSMIDMIWKLHPEVYRTNVFQLHPPGNRIETLCGPKAEAIPGYPQLIKGKGRGYVLDQYAGELERLGDELLRIDPNLIICLGNSALWALSGKTGVSKLRGTTSVSSLTVSGFKLLATYHPAAVLRQWELRPVTVMDLMKAKREAEYPDLRRPDCEIWIEPTLQDLYDFRTRYIDGCRILSVDIETRGNRITCIGFSPYSTIALVVPLDDERQKDGNYWRTHDEESNVWAYIKGILADRRIPKVFQNGLYDIAFLWRAYGMKVLGATEDTMLAHHAMQPESLKSLAFLGSCYTDHGPWKSERKGSPTTIKSDA